MSLIVRTVRSFVRRERRSTNKNFPHLFWQRYGIEQEAIHTLIDHLNRFSITTLEIGFGTGDTFFEQAKNNPNQGYVGIEVYRTGIKKLLAKLSDYPLHNVKLLEEDAAQLVKNEHLYNRFDNIQILFPDPWPKRKHYKRRLIQPNFLNLLYRLLKFNGFLYLGTDCESYAYHMRDSLEASVFIKNAQIITFADRPTHFPLTKFEKRGESLGHGTWYLVVTK